MASIMKRGDSYSVRYKYKDHSGKPCEGWESFKTRKEAQERKITVEKELLDGTFLVPDTMTMEEMLYKWIPIQSTKHKWSPKTYTQSVAMVQNLIVPYIGKRKVQDPEFEQIVFHGLRHSSATYQLLQSDGDFKSVQGNTGHATASVLMDTYAHTQDKPRLELTEKIEANFYSQDLTPAASQPRQNEKPAATKITGKAILEAIRLMDADERRELTRALFA